MRTSQSK